MWESWWSECSCTKLNVAKTKMQKKCNLRKWDFVVFFLNSSVKKRFSCIKIAKKRGENTTVYSVKLVAEYCQLLYHCAGICRLLHDYSCCIRVVFFYARYKENTDIINQRGKRIVWGVGMQLLSLLFWNQGLGMPQASLKSKPGCLIVTVE